MSKSDQALSFWIINIWLYDYNEEDSQNKKAAYIVTHENRRGWVTIIRYRLIGWRAHYELQGTISFDVDESRRLKR